jgi:molybdopterin molybdotransferase
MIHPDDAIRLIGSLDIRLGSEKIDLAAALGRVPASAPVSLVDRPPFDKSTMDGFAYRSPDGGMAGPGEAFVLVGSVAAGSPPPRPLAAGECVRIMTGAPVPEGASAVHRLERSEASGGRVLLSAAEDAVNIIRRGANGRSGEELLPRRPLSPQDIGLLAAGGIAEIEAVRRPRVRVLSSGDELRAAGRALGPGLIYDSNGPLLVAQAALAGCLASFEGIVPDDETALRDAIGAASRDADLIIVSGGVSAGDFDFVPKALERAGFSVLFRGLAMRPGMPALLGRRAGTFAYGMPGNPVSAFVNFEMMVKPLLWRLAGIVYEPRTARVRMAEAVSRVDAERVEFLPVEIRGGLVFPLRYTGSTMLEAIVRASALVRLEIGQSGITEGSETDARLL